jgi:hypothetical protein
MKKYLLFTIVLTLALVFSACGVKPVNSVPCPAESGLSGDCKITSGDETMMASSNVPVGLATYTYVVITAPGDIILNANVTYGSVKIEGNGTNVVRLYRTAGTIASAVITVKASEYPVKVQFTGYGQP